MITHIWKSSNNLFTFLNIWKKLKNLIFWLLVHNTTNPQIIKSPLGPISRFNISIFGKNANKSPQKFDKIIILTLSFSKSNFLNLNSIVKNYIISIMTLINSDPHSHLRKMLHRSSSIVTSVWCLFFHN